MANPNPVPALQNLKPWRKGCPSPNPGGRPKKLPYHDAALIFANTPAPEIVVLKLNRMFPCANCQGQGTTGTTKPRRCRVCHGKKLERIIHDGATWAECQACAAHIEAVKGSLAHLRELADRIEGSSPQRLELTTPTTQEIRFVCKYENPGTRKA